MSRIILEFSAVLPSTFLCSRNNFVSLCFIAVYLCEYEANRMDVSFGVLIFDRTLFNALVLAKVCSRKFNPIKEYGFFLLSYSGALQNHSSWPTKTFAILIVLLTLPNSLTLHHQSIFSTD